MVLRSGYLMVAQKLQESADSMTHGDVRARLSDAVHDAHKGTGKWASYMDHTGDGESGDCIYSCDGEVKSAPYEIGNVGGKATAHLDTDSAISVVPRTTYQPQADDDDHYAGMSESMKSAGLYTDLPIYERFIGKAERGAADEDSFAGKGKSFPILKPEDVKAAVHALGRAGQGNYGMAALKARIISIAKKKGWTKQLPKSWQGDETSATEALRVQEYSPDQARDDHGKWTGDAEGASGRASQLSGRANASSMGASSRTDHREAALDHATAASAHSMAAEMHRDEGNNQKASYHERMAAKHDAASQSHRLAARGKSNASESSFVVDTETLALMESATTLEPIVIREAKADYEIKLIAPGKGSSAFYPAEVLKRDGPRVFGAGTHVYLNHPTSAEEAARPEGDVNNLAGVLTSGAVYHENHAKGPGLYARMKVFSDHAATVEEKAPHVGMSIRASGVAESGKSRDGVPVLKELTHAESVDVVTRAGAGGMILTEAARAAEQPQENDMDLTEAQKLIEAAVAPFRERALRGDAREEATRLLATVTLPDAAKTKIIESALKQPLPLKEGALDTAKFREVVVAEAKDMGDILAAMLPAGVRGMGVTMPTRLSEADQIAAKERRLKEERRQRKEAKRLQESATDVFATLMGGNRTAAEKAARGVIQ